MPFSRKDVEYTYQILRNTIVPERKIKCGTYKITKV